MDLITQAQTLQASVMRGVSDAELVRLRGVAHTYLGAYLDHMSAAGVAIREHVEDTKAETAPRRPPAKSSSPQNA